MGRSQSEVENQIPSPVWGSAVWVVVWVLSRTTRATSDPVILMQSYWWHPPLIQWKQIWCVWRLYNETYTVHASILLNPLAVWFAAARPVWLHVHRAHPGVLVATLLQFWGGLGQPQGHRSCAAPLSTATRPGETSRAVLLWDDGRARAVGHRLDSGKPGTMCIHTCRHAWMQCAYLGCVSVAVYNTQTYPHSITALTYSALIACIISLTSPCPPGWLCRRRARNVLGPSLNSAPG